MWLFIGLAILFQPIEKLALGRTLWNFIDVAVAIFLVWYNFTKKETNKKILNKEFRN